MLFTDPLIENASHLAYHNSGGKFEYFIKWVGFSHKHNSWEPAAMFYESQPIDEYWKQKGVKDKGETKHTQARRDTVQRGKQPRRSQRKRNGEDTIAGRMQKRKRRLSS